MPSLTDKLKSLGVRVGAQDLPPPRPRNPFTIDQVVAGSPYATPQGETYRVEERYPPAYQHGRTGLLAHSPLDTLAAWCGEPRITQLPPQSFAYLDTETTGLSGGTGTYAFLIGVGRFEGDEFHLAQFFMRDPAEEPAQLAALEEFIAPCQALVTFNGKAFDVPLLNTRFITHGWRSPFYEAAHVDLLHLARRLWRDRLPSRTLTNLEAQILGALRTTDDVPGWMIPSLYFQYLRDGDARPLRSVFYHNAMDVVSMAALFNYTAGMLADPFAGPVEHPTDLIAMARLYEDLGDIQRATRLYVHGLEHDLPKDVLLDAILRLAAIYKRRGDYDSAAALWERAAGEGRLDACIELAKMYEHHARNLDAAIAWTQAARSALASPAFSAFERRQWLPDLDHRLERLLHKSAGQP